jgi:hypothetical protein
VHLQGAGEAGGRSAPDPRIEPDLALEHHRVALAEAELGGVGLVDVDGVAAGTGEGVGRRTRSSS